MTVHRRRPRVGRPPNPWKCPRCHDQRWVCRAHAGRPFDDGNCCTAAGMPCPECNAGNLIGQRA